MDKVKRKISFPFTKKKKKEESIRKKEKEKEQSNKSGAEENYNSLIQNYVVKKRFSSITVNLEEYSSKSNNSLFLNSKKTISQQKLQIRR